MGLKAPAHAGSLVNGASHDRMTKAKALRRISDANQVVPQKLIKTTKGIMLYEPSRLAGKHGLKWVACHSRALEQESR